MTERNVVVEGNAIVEVTKKQLTRNEQDQAVKKVMEAIARVAHEVNRAYCKFLHDETQKTWEETPDELKLSAIHGVMMIARNPTLTPAQQHSYWMAEKLSEGWTLGAVKNIETKTHPCLVPYDQLPHEQQVKDILFGAVVRALLGAPQP